MAVDVKLTPSDRRSLYSRQERGGKMVAFVMAMVAGVLTWKSISGYVWGMRTWMMHQHQAGSAKPGSGSSESVG